MILTFPVWQTRALSVMVSGSLCIVIAILLIYLCHTMKNVKRKMFWHRALTIVLLAAAVLHIAVYMIDFAQYRNHIKEIQIEDVDISAVPDGAYVGEYNAGYIYAKVQVTVESGRIKDIKILEHKNEHGSPAESIVNHIIEEQRLTVDAVTGATNSSRVIQKACEDALGE